MDQRHQSLKIVASVWKRYADRFIDISWPNVQYVESNFEAASGSGVLYCAKSHETTRSLLLFFYWRHEAISM